METWSLLGARNTVQFQYIWQSCVTEGLTETKIWSMSQVMKGSTECLFHHRCPFQVKYGGKNVNFQWLIIKIYHLGFLWPLVTKCTPKSPMNGNPSGCDARGETLIRKKGHSRGHTRAKFRRRCIWKSQRVVVRERERTMQHATGTVRIWQSDYVSQAYTLPMTKSTQRVEGKENNKCKKRTIS